MKQFDVTGMTCAACSARVEKAVSGVDGVSVCTVSLLTNSMTVEGSVSDAAVIDAVEKAGYKARVKGGDFSEKRDNAEKKEEKGLKIRLFGSVLLLLALMYFSMGYSMWNLPLPSFFDGKAEIVALVQALLSLIILIINNRFFVNGIKGVIHKAPNMDTLVAMGSGVSFLYSLYVLLDAAFLSPESAAMGKDLLHNLYFESAAMIVTLITVGKMLETRSKGRTTDALRRLIRLAPDKAVIEKDGTEITVKASELSVGDIFIVRSGDRIPADGIVIEGTGAVDEAALTGESIPADKAPGDTLRAGTVNFSGMLKCRVTKTGNDTMLSGIIKMVSDAAATKAPVAKTADKVAGIFVPVVILIAIITSAVWLLLGETAGAALQRGIAVLVVSCPCALGLATPVAIMAGSGKGASSGILFKNAASLENAGKIKIVALDKTGTVTEGRPVVTDIIPADGITEDEFLGLAFSLEYASEHPLGRAVCEKATEKGAERKAAGKITVLPGNGIECVVDGRKITGGSLKFIEKRICLSENVKNAAEALAADGKTPLVFTIDNGYLGIIAVADVIREDSRRAIEKMKAMGLYTVMLTGDNALTAGAVGRQAGVDKVIAGVLPHKKQAVISSLQKNGVTAMIGDGINDAPALTKADVGIAIGNGTDVAIDSADIVLINSNLTDAVRAINLGRAVLKTIYENLLWAFGYNIIGIPLAAGAFVSVLGWRMNPMFGAAAMSISSFLVVTNALRLNYRKLDKIHRRKRIKDIEITEEKVMTKTMKIEGMMCMHCEARVKKILEAIDGVEEAEVSHEKGTAVLTLSESVADEILTEAVAAQDYTVIGIE
ncbi:MAG: heavy metal translocating P-type ATPase [Clostridia bacterium]|nr:heavy metal translocating P-type ATPase [Clostridia bacterium]